MPSNTERSREERLADVYGRAARIRRRHRLAGGGAVAGSLALVTGLLVGVGDRDRGQVDLLAGPASTVTTGLPAASSPPADPDPGPSTTVADDLDAPVATTTTTAAPRAETADDPAGPTATTDTTSAPVCRNSSDPACGPVHYEPPPVNGPMTVEVVASPSTASPGEDVVFTVTVHDDGPITPGHCINTQSYGDGGAITVCTASCVSGPFGRWDTPPPRPQTVVEEFRHAYEAPGTYTAEFTYNVGADCEFSPYRSTAGGRVTVTVG